LARRKHREAYQGTVGVGGLFSTAFGSVGSSIFYALGIVALYALGATWLVFLLAGLVFVLTAWSYAEATALHPEDGGAAGMARRAFNQLIGFGAGWALLLDYVITIAISAFFVPHYLATFWPALKQWPYSVVAGVAVVVVLAVVNIFGLKSPPRLGWLLALLVLLTQVLLIVVAFILLFEPRIVIDQVNFGVRPTWSQFLYAIPLGAVAYTGLDSISTMAPESWDPRRHIPRALNLLLPVTIVVSVGLALVGLSALPVKSNVLPVDPLTGFTRPLEVVSRDGQYYFADRPGERVFVQVERRGMGWRVPALRPTGSVYQDGEGRAVTRLYGTQLGSAYLEDPVQGIVQALPATAGSLRRMLEPLVGILAAAILVMAANAGLAGSSRVIYSLAYNRQIPSVLGSMLPWRMTPYVGTIVAGLVAAGLMIPGHVSLLAELYAFGTMLSFTAVHLSVIVLRYKEPGLARPFRVPLNIRLRGTALPLLPIIGALCTLAVWVVVLATRPTGRIIGLAWMAGGLVLYVVYRKIAGYPLLREPGVAKLPVTATVDIDYNQILVPVTGTRLTDEMLVLACQLATEKGSSIDALYVMEVPMDRPLTAATDEQRERAERVLKAAAAIAEEFGVGVRTHTVPSRQAGRAIVDMAAERKSEVVILGAVRKRRIAERVFGDTVEYVLRHAPTEVIVNLVPSEYPMDGSADEATTPAG